MKIRKWQIIILVLIGFGTLKYLDWSLQSQSVGKNPPFKYTVEQNDTCIKIAYTFKVSIESIIQLNKLEPTCDNIYTGQTLLIPYPTPTITPFGYVFIELTSPPIIDCATTFLVLKKGDTLEDISKYYNVPIDVLVNYNDIINEEEALQPGNSLVIPLCIHNSDDSGFVSTPTSFYSPNEK